jgi:predicted RNase H-like nuclease
VNGQTVVGVDSCKSRWCYFAVGLPSRQTEIGVYSDFASLASRFADAVVIAVDIPVGLWEQGDRPCDKAARELLGWPRRCSVFAPPPPLVLGAPDYPDACRLSLEVSGKKLNKQTFALLPKIREVDDCVKRRAGEEGLRIIEVHPEVSFWALNGGRPLQSGKKRQPGFNERLGLLKSRYPGLPDLLVSLPSGVARDDLLDAAVAAWTGERFLRGDAVVLPHAPVPPGASCMQIVY